MIASLLVVGGLVGLDVGAREAPRGPSLANPVGETALAPVPGASVTTPTPPDTAGELAIRYPAPSTLSGVTTTSEPLVVRPLRDYPARSLPVHLEIARLGISVGLGSLGLNADGSVQVPSDFAVPGWFRGGVTPGQQGSAVILGHVDSKAGPAVFYRLGDVRPGEHIVVSLADGVNVEFTVIGLRMYAKDDFPGRDVYGARAYAALQLVTCGGVFDATSGHYLSNLVVYSVMTNWSRSRS